MYPAAPPPPPAAPAPAPAPAAARNATWRMLALVPLVAGVLMWASHHLALAARFPAVAAALAAAVPVALAWVGRMMDAPAADRITGLLLVPLRRHLTARSITLAYLLALVVMAVCSSVVVVADGASVRLLPLDGGQAMTASGAPAARFVLPVQPFGRTLRLEVAGFVPQTVTVYPLAGLRLDAARDLQRTPSVLLRLSRETQNFFADDSPADTTQPRQVLVQRLLPGGGTQTVAQTTRAHAAYLLGRSQPVPAALLAQWDLELLALGVMQPQAVADRKLHWRRPLPLPLAPDVVLAPGDTLQVQVFNRVGNLLAQTRFTLGNDALQDEAVPEEE